MSLPDTVTGAERWRRSRHVRWAWVPMHPQGFHGLPDWRRLMRLMRDSGSPWKRCGRMGTHAPRT